MQTWVKKKIVKESCMTLLKGEQRTSNSQDVIGQSEVTFNAKLIAMTYAAVADSSQLTIWQNLLYTLVHNDVNRQSREVQVRDYVYCSQVATQYLLLCPREHRQQNLIPTHRKIVQL